MKRRSPNAMHEEMSAHIEMETDFLVSQGVAPDEARRQALAAFGGVTRHVEDARDAWPLRWLENIARDVRFALRSLARSPGFTLGAVAALALGIGANIIVFSAVDSVAFRPLAVRAPEQLVALYARQGEASLLNISYPTFRDLQRERPGLGAVAAVTEAPVTIGDAGPSVVWAAHVSDNYFEMLGVVPAAGVLTRLGDGGSPVVLSYTTWMTSFGGSRDAIGRTLRINGAAFTIVGVAPEQFTGTRLFTYEPSVWLPIAAHPLTLPASDGLLDDRGANRFLVLGRLAPGTTIDDARQRLGAFAKRLTETYPDLYRALSFDVVSNRTPINPWLAPPERFALIGWLSLAGVFMLVLVACVNVASLLLSRMAARREEIAVRLSLGASRGRLVQQLFIESLMLAMLGAIAAIPIVMVGKVGVNALTPPLDYASSWRPAEGFRTLAYSIALVVGSALIFGLGPAIQAARRSVAVGLRPSAPRFRVRVRGRELLVVVQVALAVMTLAVGSMFARSLSHVRAVDPGFPLDGAIAFTLDPQLLPSFDASRTKRLYDRVEEQLKASPGAPMVGRATSLPLDGNGGSRRVFVDDRATTLDRAPAAEFATSAPGFFEAIGIPVVAGRDFQKGDTASSSEPVVINEVLARRLWPRESAIGKRLRLDSPAAREIEVIGVTRTANYRAVGERPRAAMWLDLERHQRSRTTFVVRSPAAPATLLGAARGVVRDASSSLPIIGAGSLRDHLAPAYAAVRSGAYGAASFGLLALLLTASGLYGLVSYRVAQQRREIAVRVALGAPAGRVVRLVAARTGALALAGIAIGLAIVAFVPMGLDHILFGVPSRDPVSLAGAALFFGTIAGAAALIPASRAARIDPMHALRLTALLLCAALPVARAQAQSPIELGRAAYNQRHSDEAIKWFEKAVAANEDSVMPHVWLGRAYVQALPQASFIRQPILARRARAQFDRALELDPANQDAREDRATYYMYAPSIAGGGIDKARSEAEILRAANAYRGGILRGRIEQHDGKTTAAIHEYTTVLTAYPDSVAPFNLVVGLYQTGHQFAEAFAVVDRRRTALPGERWGQYQLGKTAALSGERLDQGEAALREYIRAAKFDPSATEAHAHNRLGMILEQKKDARGARAEYEAALALDPSLKDAKQSLARLGGSK